MSDITIQETYTLPSKGKIYSVDFDPTVTIRSMTVAEEMKRLSSTDTPYRAMCEIIDACIENTLPISSYDMCLGDYQFLLHRLRVVTYGSDYNVSVICPYCYTAHDETINLDALSVKEYSEDLKDLLTFKLPVTKETVTIGFQTPRDLDNIERDKKAMKKQFPDMKDDPTLLLNITSLIKKINGDIVDDRLLQSWVKKLPMRDSNKILDMATKLTEGVGVDTSFKSHCDNCGNEINTPFRYTSEFFRPSGD